MPRSELPPLVDRVSAFAARGVYSRRVPPVGSWLGMSTWTKLRLPAQARASRQFGFGFVRLRERDFGAASDGLGDNALHALRVVGQADQEDVAECRSIKFGEGGVGLGLG